MAEQLPENNREDQSNNNPVTGLPEGSVVVGGASGKKNLFKRLVRELAKQWKALFLVLVVVAVTLGGWVLLGQHKKANTPKKEDKVVFVIDGKEYKKSEVDKLIWSETMTGANADQAAKQAFELLKRQKAAEMTGFKVSATEVKDVIKVYFKSKDNNRTAVISDWQNLLATDIALTNKLSSQYAKNTIAADGYLFIFYFGQHIEPDYEYQVPGLGDKALIAQDRTYAQTKAADYYERLRTGSITPDKALSEIKADPRLGYDKPDTNLSSKFNLSDPKQASNPLPADVKEFIKQTATKGLNPVHIGKTGAALGIPKPEDFKETYFYILLLNSVDKNKPDKAKFEETLKNISAEYKGYQ